MLPRQLITTSSLVLTGRTCCAVSGSIVHLTLGFFSPLPVIPAALFRNRVLFVVCQLPRQLKLLESIVAHFMTLNLTLKLCTLKHPVTVNICLHIRALTIQKIICLSICDPCDSKKHVCHCRQFRSVFLSPQSMMFRASVDRLPNNCISVISSCLGSADNSRLYLHSHLGRIAAALLLHQFSSLRFNCQLL
ncbi:hypothetical protein B0H19DRAFT_1147737, partial [Mycena capillaripes]